MSNVNTSQDPDYVGPTGHEKKFHKDHFQGVDTSQFKVWVLKRGKLVRTTKEKALTKGYKIVASTRRRPKEYINEPTTPNSTNSNNGG